MSEHQEAPTIPQNAPAGVSAVDEAVAQGRLAPKTAENVKRWLTETGYAEWAPQVRSLLDAGNYAELETLFWEVIPFGTGGRRGPMAEFGSATINVRTIAESANGVAVYLEKVRGRAGGRAAVACDTRLRSSEFASLSACVLSAQGLKVFLFDGPRSTPELSFAVRHLRCDVGLMISASHNPPGDNGVKAYWSNGAQVLPPHDAGIIESVYQSNEIPVDDFDQAVAEGKIELIGEDVDNAYVRSVRTLSVSSARDLRAMYTPLHGVGETSVFRVLEEAGFEGVEVYEPHRSQDGHFPNVPDRLPNPERPAVFEPAIERAKEIDAALVLASDPDADRLGVSVRDEQGKYVHLTGNRLAALLADYILRKRKASGTLGPQHYIVETLVTTPLVAAIARSFKVRAIDNLLVGFKYIALTMDREGAERFLFGCEESLGYLAGSYARDKDAALAALYICECAAELRKQGKTLLDRLDELYVAHGFFLESQKSETRQGREGREQIERLMDELRTNPPRELAGIPLARVRDYAKHEIRKLPDNERSGDLPEPEGDLIFFDSEDTAEGRLSFAARPSGTEPKIKFYFFAHASCPDAGALSEVKARTEERLRQFERALSAYTESVPRGA